jgi:hypothetical protein
LPVIPNTVQSESTTKIQPKTNQSIYSTLPNHDKNLEDYFSIKQKKDDCTSVSFTVNKKKQTYNLYKKKIDDNSVITLLKNKKILKNNRDTPLQLQKDLYNLLIDDQICVKRTYFN